MTAIKQPDGSICRTGPTCKRHGVKQATRTSMVTTATGEPVNIYKPVANPLQLGKLVLPSHPLTANTIIEEVVDYKYDSYGCQGTCDPDDYCRDAEYEGLRAEITPVVKL